MCYYMYKAFLLFSKVEKLYINIGEVFFIMLSFLFNDYA